MIKIPTNAVVKYRILTEKSVPDYGKYADLPISEIIKVDPNYVPWLYFNTEKISLCKELKERFNLPDIPKPGTDKEAYFRWLDERRDTENLTPEQKQKIRWSKYNGKKKYAKAKLIRAKKETYLSKSQLQAINHGHYNN